MTAAPKGSSLAVIQTLAWMEKNKFKPVPLNPGSKEVIPNCADYVTVEYRPPPSDDWRVNDWGLGMVTGPASGGPVDVDLDCTEAEFFAPRFLPPTRAVFGRKSKPRSHFLFRVSDPAFAKVAYSDPKTRKTILELRGDKHQTVAPGSINPSGESVAWADAPFPEVTLEPQAALIKAAQKTALAVIVSRYCWGDGFRNEPTVLLSGMAWHCDWTIDETLNFIQALMDFSEDKDKSRLATVNNTYRRGESGKSVAGSGALRKLLKDDVVVDAIAKLMGSEAPLILMEYNDRFATVMWGGSFCVADTSLNPIQFYTQANFLSMRQYDNFISLKGKRVYRADVWLDNPKRRRYDRVEFIPGNVDDDGEVLNLWRGFAVEPDPHAKCDAWLSLTRDVICGSEPEFNWVMNWLAAILREPADPVGTALAVVGVQGAGKSLFFKYFGKILGPSYVMVTDPEHVHGRFTGHMSTALLLHSEEALYGGDLKHRGVIRSLITADTRMAELKGVDAVQVRNYARLALSSNDRRVVPASDDDRRFTVLDLLTDRRKISPAAIKDVVKEMGEGGPAALLHYLTKVWNYDRSVVTGNFKNKALHLAKMENQDSFTQWWVAVLNVGRLLPDDMAWASEGPTLCWPEYAGVSAACLSMIDWCERHKVRVGRMSPADFGMRMRAVLGNYGYFKKKLTFKKPSKEDLPMYAHSLGAKRQFAFRIPPIIEGRKQVDMFMGTPYEWDDIDETPEQPQQKIQSDKPKY